MKRAALLLLWLAAGVPAAAQVTITEFMAANLRVLQDRDGLSADWIELHNAGGAGGSVVDLAGLFLSNDPERRNLWRFPSVTLPPGGYMLVFASGKGRAEPGAPLHTNFKLDREGGEILLVGSDGNTLLARTAYGPQLDDVSQGFDQDHERVVLLAPDAPGRMLVPDAAIGAGWIQPEYDDSGWTAGRGGFGFERAKARTLGAALGTDVAEQVRGRSSSAYYRFAFEVADPAAHDLAVLRIRFEAGFVAYLNGREIARRRTPKKIGPDTFDAAAEVGLEPRDMQRWEYFEIPDPHGLLRAGTNVLAVHGLLESANSLEHLVLVEVEAYSVGTLHTDALMFFGTPTPGRPNDRGFPSAVSAPVITPDGALFADTTQATILGAIGCTTRYTLDGSEPGPVSPVYEGPLTLETSALLKARCFRDGALPSTSASAPFTKLDPELRGFSSDLPLIVVSTYGREVLPKEFVDAHVHVVEVAPGERVALGNAPAYSGPGAIKLRGSSTLDLPKNSYGFELRDAAGRNRSAALLGFPPDSDWVLYGPHNWDQAHIRNALSFELARWLGLESPRCRFVEVFLDREQRPLRRDDYIGLYLLIERVSRGRHRVDVEELKPEHDREPAVTGGYILKIDRPGPGDMGFEAGGQRLQFVYPEEREITDPQRRWLKQHFEGFAAALDSQEFDDASFGYHSWIDTDNWIDYHFFNEYTKNPDAFTLSTYMYKQRRGKILMGPVWDHDRVMRTNDEEYWVGRPARPTEWTGDSRSGWWGKLFRDEEFRLRYGARARALLVDELALERVLGEVDRLADVIEEAEERDRLRWPIIAPGGWYNEIIELKDWIRARDSWLRSELMEIPQFTSSTGTFKPPCTVTLTQGNESGIIYYTLDGSDPTLIDGSLSPRATPYTEPVEITAPLRLRARVLAARTWSKIAEVTFLVNSPKLAITEIMYNPDDSGDYEFIELANYGTDPIELDRIDIDGPIRFSFSIGEIRSLEPGERVVIVRDRHQFADRYDITQVRLAGEYFGRFSNTEGTLRVTGTLGETLASAYYRDAWFPETDGKGYSLVAIALEAHMLEQDQWQQSPETGGSPGQ